MKNLTIIICAVLALSFPAVAAEEEQDTEKNKDKSAGKVAVVSVSPPAEKLLPGEGQNWQPLKEGDELSETTLIRTGLKAKVVLKFAEQAEVTIDRATKVGIGQFRQKQEVVNTDLGLKYGKVEAEVESAEKPNDFRVSTPVATLSVRGSQPIVNFGGDFGVLGRSAEGNLNVVGPRGSQTIRPGETTTGNKPLPVNLAKHNFAVNLLDVLGGLTGPERFNQINNGSGRGVFGPSGTRPLNNLRPFLSSSSHSSPNGSENGYYITPGE